MRPSLDGLHATVGDEFQGVYASLSEALGASLLVRLELLGVVDTRYGIGLGEREILDADRSPALEDGSAWWAARAAIDALGGSQVARNRRTWFVADPSGTPPAPAGIINALLLCRDGLVDRLGDTAHRMLLASLGGSSQREIALACGVSESAVSQQFARGVGAVRDAQRLLTDLDTLA